MSLAEKARALAEEKQQDERARRQEEAKKQVRHVLEVLWPESWYAYPKQEKKLMEGLDEMPPIDKHERARIERRGRYTGLANCIVVHSDGIRFAYVTDHGDNGWYIVMTCPACGNDYLDRYYSVASIGALMRFQESGKMPSWTDHTCYESAAKRIASELKIEAQTAKISVHDLAQRALQETGGLW